MEPCKHGHVDGARHIPCLECAVESARERNNNALEAIAKAESYIATLYAERGEDLRIKFLCEAARQQIKIAEFWL